MRIGLKTAGFALLSIACSSEFVSAGLPKKHYLPLELATTAAQAAVRHCEEGGYSISVFVLDRSGETIVSMRGDDAKPHHYASARRKAYTALTFQMPSGKLPELVTEHPEASGLLSMEGVIALGGGLPIKAGNDVIGAIGVAGGSSSSDGEACAEAGIAAIFPSLK
jgi:uncharacterized protein GlcG (DUF336 family)